MACLCKPFTTAAVRHFTFDRLEQAYTWLGRRSLAPGQSLGGIWQLFSAFCSFASMEASICSTRFRGAWPVQEPQYQDLFDRHPLPRHCSNRVSILVLSCSATD
jgi:hypothetical protein